MSTDNDKDLNLNTEDKRKSSIFIFKEINNLSQPTTEIKESYRFQYLAATLASLSWFTGGTISNWTSPTLSLMQNRNPPLLTSSEASWLASQLPLGSIFGSFFIGIITKHFGRKFGLLTSVVSFLLSLILCYSAINVTMLYAGRFIAGFGTAATSIVCSLYIGEISEKNIRGRLLILASFMSNLGCVVSLSIGPFVSYHNFLAILSAFPVFFFITFIFMPESPYFQVKKGNIDGAKQSISLFCETKDELTINKKLKSIEQSVEFDMNNKGTYWELISNAKTRKSVLILLGVKTIMHLSAISAIHAYMQPLFDKTQSFISSEVFAIIGGVTQMGFGLLSYFFIDNFGRKPVFLVSMIGCLTALTGAGTYFLLIDYLGKDESSYTWLLVCSIMMLVAMEPIGVGCLGSIFQAELFPINQKENAGVVAITYSSMMAAIVVKLFGMAKGNNLLFLGFFTCAVLMGVGVIFAIFFIPETKRKSLHEIQTEINTK